MDNIIFVLNQYLELVAYMALGYGLKRIGIFKEADGETALKFARYITIPAVIISTLCDVTFQKWMLIFPAAALLHALLTVAFSTALHFRRPQRERAQLIASSTGLSVNTLLYPLLESTFGPTGLFAALLFDLPNLILKHLLGYSIHASAGTLFPSQYKHDDGGVYQGEWVGTKKEGLGVYRYTSGARYEGEWRDNVKQGRGIYYYPKGGVYEGEWSGGVPEGMGARTFASGRVKAGRWRGGELDEPCELWQCVNAVQGATEAADASKRLQLGGFSFVELGRRFLSDTPLLAALLTLTLTLLRLDLPLPLESAAISLSAANKPLILLSLGMAARFSIPRPLLPDVCRILTLRLLPALSLGMMLPFAESVFQHRQFPAVAFTLIMVLTMMAPVPEESRELGRRFRLSATFADALYHASLPLSLVLCVVMGVTSYVAADAGVLALVRWVSAGMAALLVAVTTIVTLQQRTKVRMVLATGDVGAARVASSPLPPPSSSSSPSPSSSSPGGIVPSALPAITVAPMRFVAPPLHRPIVHLRREFARSVPRRPLIKPSCLAL